MKKNKLQMNTLAGLLVMVRYEFRELQQKLKLILSFESQYFIQLGNKLQISMSEEKGELRLKIKKLKYKIEKQEKNIEKMQQDQHHLRAIQSTELGISRVLKKIHFLLSLKGMTITDWVNSSHYQFTRNDSQNKLQISIDQLIQQLDNMNIKLESAQKNILLNFCNKNLSCWVSSEEFFNVARQCGVRTA